MNDKISKVFGERLKNLRDARGLRQEDVGDWFKMQKSTVSQWENGRLPHVMILNELADKFGVTVDYLLGRTDKAVTHQTTALAVSPEDLALLEKWKNLPPEKRKAIEILTGPDEQAAEVGN